MSSLTVLIACLLALLVVCSAAPSPTSDLKPEGSYGLGYGLGYGGAYGGYGYYPFGYGHPYRAGWGGYPGFNGLGPYGGYFGGYPYY